LIQSAEQGIADSPDLAPTRRPDLIVKPHGSRGQHVVKDPSTGAYFNLGPHETFLLLALDGVQTRAQIRASFERQFGQMLSEDDLEEFLRLAGGWGFLRADPGLRADATTVWSHDSVAPGAPKRRPRQSLLYWRKSLYDPDHHLSFLEPRVRFLWSRWFAVISIMLIVAAAGVVWANGHELVSRYAHGISWEMLALAWLVLIGTTACHEYAHGLTCKHYGGEVHEIGVLVLFFTPCFYCNVSDAWLFREKSKRLLVTLAGGYCDLVIWALAVMMWRLTLLDTAINYLAWIVLSVCSVRIFFNLNPLLKLDGYYLLSDWLAIPNLRQRAWDAVTGRIRWWLWGAPRMPREKHQRFLMTFGVVSWFYSMAFLLLLLLAIVRFLGARWGVVGFLGAVVFGMIVMRGMLRGLSAGEVTKMIRTRWLRTFSWIVILGSVAAAMMLVNVNRNAAGSFLIRPLVQSEVQAPVSGFLQAIHLKEGDVVEVGGMIAHIDIPDLASHVVEKRSEIAEIQSKLRQCKVELDYARDDSARAEDMRTASAMSVVELRNAHKHRQACESELEQTQSRLDRAQEELAVLEARSAKASVRSSIKGMITTAHLDERTGQFVEEGDPICLVQEVSLLLAEIQLPEQEVSRVRVGAPVTFKARALPFDTFHGKVRRIAPTATPGDIQSHVTIYCEIDDPPSGLQSGMTGYARIECGRRNLGRAALEYTLTFLRTEFWW
jgi:putative peptide zinc metalloprotease protein